jgi:hypothetical protein
MRELYTVNTRKVVGTLVIALVIGLVQCWIVYEAFALRRQPWSLIVLVSFSAILTGWLLVAAAILSPPSKNEWRRMMHGLVAVCGGMAGLSARANVERWRNASLIGLFIITLLALLPISLPTRRKNSKM